MTDSCFPMQPPRGRLIATSFLAAIGFIVGSAVYSVSAAALTLAESATVCVPVGSTNFNADPDPADVCEVVAFKPIAGTTPALFYQHQIFLTPDQARRHPDLSAAVNDPAANGGAGMAVLQMDPGHKGLTLVAGMSGGDAYFDPPPHLEVSPQGPLLLLPASATASSAPNLGVAMRRLNGRWVQIVDKWSGPVVSRLPADVAQWKGDLMDWRHLTVISALWHKYDHNCCPTGGSYYAKLKLEGARLELVSLRISKDGLPD